MSFRELESFLCCTVLTGCFSFPSSHSLFSPALQLTPELPKQHSGIFSVPEYNGLFHIISAELSVSPISPVSQVLRGLTDCTQKERTKSQKSPAIWSLWWWEEPKIWTMMQNWNSQLQKENFTYWRLFFFPALYCHKGDFCEVFLPPCPCMCSIVVTLMNPSDLNPALNFFNLWNFEGFLVHLPLCCSDCHKSVFSISLMGF